MMRMRDDEVDTLGLRERGLGMEWQKQVNGGTRSEESVDVEIIMLFNRSSKAWVASYFIHAALHRLQHHPPPSSHLLSSLQQSHSRKSL